LLALFFQKMPVEVYVIWVGAVVQFAKGTKTTEDTEDTVAFSGFLCVLGVLCGQRGFSREAKMAPA
jgi:hypothetical protein